MSDIASCAHGVELTESCPACADRSAGQRAYEAGANARQVGGDHYKGTDYEHWDFVTDIDLPYLPAVATKYVVRWREKNGVQDLEKAIHYLDKAIERDVLPPQSLEASKLLGRFMLTINDITDAHIVGLIVTGNYEIARNEISLLIEGVGL